MSNEISRRNILKYAALGSVSFSLGGSLIIPGFSYAQSKEAGGYILINGGSFTMGSPDSEFLREKDETRHTVSVSDFYMGRYAVTQKEYREITGENPSGFKRDDAPVENVTWYDAVRYCNALSSREGLTPAYAVNGFNVTWNRNAAGYRLPTEAEWEYAARAGTSTPFYTGSNITARQANWYGTYPYNSDRQQEYRGRTVSVGGFASNPWGLFDMSGNVWEWCWDWYAQYGASGQKDPAGPESGVYKVHRGGGWNDFGRHLRSAYRAAFTPVNKLYNIGFRVARNAANTGMPQALSSPMQSAASTGGKSLVLYFTWSGNTGMLAREIQKKTGADIRELEMETPYSRNYSTCLTQSRRDQQRDERPKVKPVNLDGYDVIYLGYPTWWATMPMPMWTFLEQNDFSNKTIIPFASHGEGRLGQTLSAIAKSVPQTTVKEGFSIMYSNLSKRDMEAWLDRVSR